jgi:hypothetical protein
VPRAYRTVRDHLDDIIGLARCVFEQHKGAKPARLAELQFEIADRAEQIESSLELARIASMPLPLDRLRKAFKLEAEEVRCLYLLLGLAVSTDVRALANSDGTGSIELLDQLVYTTSTARDRLADHLASDGRLFGYGLIEFADESRSRFARPIRVSDRVVDLAFGRDRAAAELAGFGTLTIARPYELLIPEAARAEVRAALKRHADFGCGPVPVIRGVLGAGRRALVSSIAHELGARMLIVHCGALPDRLTTAITVIMREAILAGAVIVLADAEHLEGDAAQGRRDRAPAFDSAFAHYSGPIAITMAKDASPINLMQLRGVSVVDLPELTEAERSKLWARHVPAALAADVAARYRVSGGHIERASQTVKQKLVEPTLADVHAAVRSVVDANLATLGARIEWQPRWDDLVLPAGSCEALREMVARVRHRRQVVDWGFGDNLAKGRVAALFCGPPGTGKTMAASLVANDLGLDLYQFDLSRMSVSELAQVFDAAAAGHAVLLFDAADATSVEASYLLERIEAFAGIAIVTANNDSAIDESFRRRLAFRIGFPMPEQDDRKRLWRALIPTQALAPNIDFDQLASRFVMSGGFIKNAAVRAAYLAAADGGLIEMRHLEKAAGAELTSMNQLS